MVNDSESNGSEKIGGVKIKQEKLTPPSSPSTSNKINGATDELVGDLLSERKPIAEPIRSSNEILADLFKVFNAAPPTIDDTCSTDTKKKKVKKDKKSKKSKKDSRRNSNSDNDSKSSADGKSRKVKKEKKRKGKKEKKHKKSKSEDDNGNTEVANDKQIDALIKKEFPDVVAGPSSTSRHGDTSKNNKDALSRLSETNVTEECDEKRPKLGGIQVSLTNDTDGSTSKRKIVIKSLANSEVFKESVKESERKEKEKKDRIKEREERKDRKRKRDKHGTNRRRSQEKRSRHRSRSSSLSLSDEETYLRERDREARQHHKERHRERESDRDKNRDRGRDREREIDDFYGIYKPYKRDSSRSSHYRHDHDRRRSRSPHRRANSEDRIDKKRLLEIARKNAITMLRNGTLPGTQNLAPDAKEKALTKMRYGGKTVDELTEYCKKLSKGEAGGYLSNMSGDSDIDEDLEKPFHHPFVIKDRGPIVMNIKNATPIPPKSAEQSKAILAQFPVSSGQHHRANENEWVPVEPPKPPKKDKEQQEQQPAISVKSTATAKPTKPKNAEPIELPTADYGYSQPTMFQQPIVASLPVPVPQVVSSSTPAVNANEQATSSNDSIFATISNGKDLDVTAIITSRLNAMRKLQDNPLDSEAIKLMYNTQKDMSAWANSKFVPGQFTGSTGANILSSKELASGFQAWAKRDQLLTTAPVSGGMGMHLLQKMGWRPGEGLGKEKNGSLQPLLLEIKLDKKGLVADEENPRQRSIQKKKAAVTSLKMAKAQFESKHPVSLLGELSSKRKLGVPQYDLVLQEGPSHQRQFLFKVDISGQCYQPNTTSLNKKEAKAAAARHALQQMGYLPPVQTSTVQHQPPPQPMMPPPPAPVVPPINPPIQSFNPSPHHLSSFQNC